MSFNSLTETHGYQRKKKNIPSTELNRSKIIYFVVVPTRSISLLYYLNEKKKNSISTFIERWDILFLPYSNRLMTLIENIAFGSIAFRFRVWQHRS